MMGTLGSPHHRMRPGRCTLLYRNHGVPAMPRAHGSTFRRSRVEYPLGHSSQPGAALLKVGIVSDLHCNLQGLDLALQAMGDIDELLCLGDSIFEYRFSNDVVARLKQRHAHIIQGNHEEVFMGSAGLRARDRPGNDPGLLDFLAEQPHRRYSTWRESVYY